ncbi:MAG TPA: FAD-dependent oxidoreductase [Nitriliruptoraceae bacterium]|nr:FAD-dependent oxidoreductase [Nitriliruptoraceae bacterium]
MPPPIILTLDDEVAVSDAVERDLRSHFGRDYRILKSTAPAEALDVLRRLKARNDEVALLLVDQRMPEMTGTEFLVEAMALYPDARRVLLTAYADTPVAITAINEIGLDHYLMKPWGPADEHLYPVLDDLLDDWQASAAHPYDGIQVAGTLWSPESHVVKDFLARSQVPYRWLDVERDADAKTAVDAANAEGDGAWSLPVVFFPDGSTLVAPTLSDLAQRVGHRTRATEEFYDVIIVGAGPAGLAAAVYGASEGLRTLLVEKETTGGQAGTSSRIENYLGFPSGISGVDLARRATTQAARLGAEILTTQEVRSVEIAETTRGVRLDEGRIVQAHALIIATGVSVRRLDAPGIDELTGAGVYYGAAMSEAANYRGAHVFVVGGANSAGQAAMYFSRFAERVTMLVRGERLDASMSRYLIDQIAATATIDVRTRTEVVSVAGGDAGLASIEILDRDGDTRETVPADALFLFIGARPHADFVGDAITRTDAGFIPTGPDLAGDGAQPGGWPLDRSPFLLETNVPGVFAVGDVRDGVVRRVASAVGQGSTAISMVHQYLKTV